MPTDVIMPQMGESILEGTLVKWLKKAGDAVAKDEPLFEISTDKVDAEIPSPVSGVLTVIKVSEGETVQVNTVVAVVSESGETTAIISSVEKSSGTDVVMPQMGESILEGTILKWLKKVGDAVAKDEPLFEISTDKVDAEISSPVSGVLTAIHVPEGITVGINTVVAVIGGTAASAVAEPFAAVQTQVIANAKVVPVPDAAPTRVLPTGQKLRSSPLVRRIAKENQLDLAQIAGSGSSGRITKEDILRHLSLYGAGAVSGGASAKAQSTASISGQKGTHHLGVQPLTKMRSIIAERMVESVRTSPHAYTVYKIDMTRIARLREREKADFERRHSIKLTYMPFIAAAAVEALERFPIVNASMLEGAIHYHPNVHLGIAVALEWGLIVPVVRNAEKRDFVSLARAIADVAERARTKKLNPDEASGSTFTLTNSGVFGGEFGTPILNQPESAILAIGGLKKEAVVLTDAEGNDTIAIRSMQHYCLGFDHRTIDGADAGKFMSAFKSILENWKQKIEGSK